MDRADSRFYFSPVRMDDFTDFENFGMLEPCRSYLDEGKMQIVHSGQY